VVDDEVNVRDWREVIWALTTRVDPVRDTMLVENTPIDYLDFALPVRQRVTNPSSTTRATPSAPCCTKQ